MSRAFFYPPGREKEQANRGFDLVSVWTSRYKVQNLPNGMRLSGMVQKITAEWHIYTAGIIPGVKPGMPVKES